MKMLKADLEKTKERYNSLKQLYTKNGLNADHFSCSKYQDCFHSQNGKKVARQFSGGTTALMPYYDLYVNNQPIRVLIIGKENAYMKNKKFGTSDNFDENIQNVLNCVEWKNKNNHIKGTLLTLQYIFEVNTDYIYAGYALTNLLRCAFQNEEMKENVSGLLDTKIMRNNCFSYLIDEINILNPTLIICQGEWAIKGQKNIVKQLYDYYKEKEKRLLANSNKKYGLYQFSNFMLITSHHPAILGNWKKNLAPDSLWPAIDYLKKIGYIPTSKTKDLTNEYLLMVKDNVDEILSTLESNDSLRH